MDVEALTISNLWCAQSSRSIIVGIAYPCVTDEEFRKLGYSREQAKLKNGLDIHIEVCQLRMREMGLSGGRARFDWILYYNKYEPEYLSAAVEYFYDELMGNKII